MSAGKRKGTIKKSVRVETNDPKNKVLTLFLTGIVKVDFSLEPFYVSFGRVTKSDMGADRFIKAIGDDCTKYQITKVEPKDPGFTANILPPEKEGEGQRISIKLSNDIPVGNFRSSMVVHSNHPKYPTSVINVRAIVMGHIRAQPERIYFRLMPDQETEEKIVTITNSEKKEFKILSMDIKAEPIPNSSARQKSVITYLEATKDDLEMKKLEPDANGNQRISLKLKRTLNPGERVQGKIILTTDDKSQEQLAIYYHAFSQLPRKNKSR